MSVFHGALLVSSTNHLDTRAPTHNLSLWGTLWSVYPEIVQQWTYAKPVRHNFVDSFSLLCPN